MIVTIRKKNRCFLSTCLRDKQNPNLIIKREIHITTPFKDKVFCKDKNSHKHLNTLSYNVLPKRKTMHMNNAILKRNDKLLYSVALDNNLRIP